jgi:hypothetical protein
MIILVHAIGILTPGATAPINLKLIIGVFNSKYKVVSVHCSVRHRTT